MENLAATRALAARYARALFDVALAQADPRAIERDLSGLVTLFEQHEPLRRVLWNPALPVARKQAVLSALLSRGGFAPPLEKLLQLMAERDQLALLPPLFQRYRRRVMDHYGIVEAEVTTASPLPPEQLQGLERALSEATGKQVKMSTRVNPAIIGGVVAKVDSTVYDGSIARQLERIRTKLTGGA